MNNDNSLGIALLDSGMGFTVFDSSMENDVPYGTFALTLMNIDYDEFRNNIAETIHQYFDKEFNPEDTERFTQYLFEKIYFYIFHASKGFLRTENALMVTNLLLREILNRIEAEHFKISNIDNCIPVIFSNHKIRCYIKEILLRHSDNLKTIIAITGTYEINSQLLYLNIPVYYPQTTADYLMLDLKMYLERSTKTVKECERCKRLFLPTRKSDKYCRLPIRRTKKTCNVIMHISPNDEFVIARDKARDRQHKRIVYYINKGKYDKTFLKALYKNWSEKCGQKFRECKMKEDIDTFIQWIKQESFTIEKIEEEWKLYKAKEVSIS